MRTRSPWMCSIHVFRVLKNGDHRCRSGRKRSECLHRNLPVFNQKRVRCEGDPRLRFPRDVRYVADRAHARNLERRPERRVGTVNKGLEKAGDFLAATESLFRRDDCGPVVVILQDLFNAVSKSAEMMIKDLLGCCYCLFRGIRHGGSPSRASRKRKRKPAMAVIAGAWRGGKSAQA